MSVPVAENRREPIQNTGDSLSKDVLWNYLTGINGYKTVVP